MKPHSPSRPALLPFHALHLVIISTLLPAPLHGQQAPAALAAFGARMVGAWEAPDTRHVFEWGVGERVVKSRSFHPRDGAWVLVSEGLWFWDPELQSLRGVVVATGMPVDLFEYTTRVEGAEIVHDLTAHGEMGGRYVERWTFVGDGYAWSLEQGGERIMGGSMRRAGAPG